MTVNPGFGNQQFLESTLPKIRRVRQMIDQINRRCDLEVDGGINATTAPRAVHAGANVLVAGSAIFNHRESVADAMKRLRESITPLALNEFPSCRRLAGFGAVTKVDPDLIE